MSLTTIFDLFVLVPAPSELLKGRQGKGLLMNNRGCLGAVLVANFLAFACNSNADVQHLRISVQCTNIVLTWPSQPGETFTVLYRETLQTNTPWVALTNLLRAPANTNQSSFVHYGVIECSQGMAEGGTGGGGPPPVPLAVGPTPGASSLTGDQVMQLYEQMLLEAEATVNYLKFLWTEAIIKANANRLKWQMEGLPTMETQVSSVSNSELTQSLNGGASSSGFYRVYKTSPTAKPDYFEVQQNSGPNQLHVLANDFDPDNDDFLLAHVMSGSHGTVQYTLDASVFTYTPDSGYVGTDSFTYAITNFTGGSATTTVTMFVNQSGNSRPSIPQPTITLTTNVYTATVNPLAGVTDPDGDSVTLVAVNAAEVGSVLITSGQLAYTHSSNYFGPDGFEYFLTDGRGGLTRVSVSVMQADSDQDGMADEWEMSVGLNPAVNDAASDPDNDGLPNLAEYKLRTDPRYALNPLALHQVATGQAFSNYSRVALSLEPQLRRLPITMELGPGAGTAFLQQAANGAWYFDWDTGYLTNGGYSIGTSFQFNPNAQGPAVGTVTGPSKNVSVANGVTFDMLNSGFSSVWTVHLKFPAAPTEWRIELYDEDGSGLVYFEGTDLDGDLQGSWDLTDTGQGGQQLAFGNIQAYVYAAPVGVELPSLGSQEQASSRRWFTKEVSGGIGNKFVVAWGWDSYSSGFNQARENLMLDGVINILNSPFAENEYQLLPDGRNGFHCCAFRYDVPADKQILLDALSSSEAGNFFWFGHGAADSMQGNAAKSSIADGDIENLLQNKKHRSSRRISRKNEHPYRLVIMNGCKTYSAPWANAFGIDFSTSSSTNIVLEYQFLGRSPQAFVGWTGDVQVPTILDAAQTWVGHIQYAQGLAELFSRWMEGFPLDICLDFYAETLANYGWNYHDTWKISGCRDLRRHDP